MLNPENNQEELNPEGEKVVNPTNAESHDALNSSATSSIQDESLKSDPIQENPETEVQADVPETPSPTIESKNQSSEEIQEPLLESIPEETTVEPVIAQADVETTNVPETEVSSDENEDSSDDDEDDETKMMDEEDAIEMDYSSFTMEQLLAKAMDAPKSLSPREAVKRIQNIRPFFDSLLKQARQEQLEKFEAEATEGAEFEYHDDGSKDKFYGAFKMAQEARSEEKKRIEEEKLKNLEAKNQIIESIKTLTESDETIHSLDEIKKLQNEWKVIRAVPKNNLQELYDRYHFYLDKFYDNFAINRELKDLDRQKNLGIKIDLCNKVDALQSEPSLKRAFILLAKYQEEFKNTGPVPKEFSEEIWTRFKSTIDSIYAQRKAQFEVLQEKRNENLKLKEVLIEKARLISNHIPSKQNEWKENFDQLNALMEEWKKIGQVPKAQNETVWQNFREQFNIFFKNRNEQFKKIHSEKKANAQLKEDLCKRAEEIKDHEDLNETTKAFIKLQEEWKNTGPVPEHDSQRLWKRFRAACDHFFNRKQAYYDNRKAQEKENLVLKKGILEEVEKLFTIENGEEVFAQIKEIQQRWNSIGHIPLKAKKAVGDQYHQQMDLIYKKFRKNREAFKQAHMKEHYNQISALPGGDKKLYSDERKLKDKINALKAEIQTWENNMEFFARSKNAEKFKKEIEDKISKVTGQIESMEKELSVIKSAKDK